MDQIAQSDAIDRTVGHRRTQLVHIAAHVLEHVDGVIGELVITSVAGAYLRVAYHEDRKAVAIAAPAAQSEFGAERGRTFWNAVEELRQPLLGFDFVTRRNGNRHETPFRQVAAEPKMTVAVGLGRLQAVAYDNSFERGSVIVEDGSLDVTALLVGDAERIFRTQFVITVGTCRKQQQGNECMEESFHLTIVSLWGREASPSPAPVPNGVKSLLLAVPVIAAADRCGLPAADNALRIAIGVERQDQLLRFLAGTQIERSSDAAVRNGSRSGVYAHDHTHTEEVVRRDRCILRT